MSKQGNVLQIPATAHRLLKDQAFSYLRPSVMEEGVCFHICFPSAMLTCQVDHSCTIHCCRIFPPLDLCRHPLLLTPPQSASPLWICPLIHIKPHGIASTSFPYGILKPIISVLFPPHNDNIINALL